MSIKIKPGLNKYDNIVIVKNSNEVNDTIEDLNSNHYKIIDIIPVFKDGLISEYIIMSALMNSAEVNEFDILNSSVESIFSLKK